MFIKFTILTYLGLRFMDPTLNQAARILDPEKHC